MAESSDVPQTSNHRTEENHNLEITTDSIVNIYNRETKSKNYFSKENYKRRHHNSYRNNPNQHQQAYNTEFLNDDNNREYSQVSNNSGYINYNNVIYLKCRYFSIFCFNSFMIFKETRLCNR